MKIEYKYEYFIKEAGKPFLLSVTSSRGLSLLYFKSLLRSPLKLPDLSFIQTSINQSQSFLSQYTNWFHWVFYQASFQQPVDYDFFKEINTQTWLKTHSLSATDDSLFAEVFLVDIADPLALNQVKYASLRQHCNTECHNLLILQG